MTRAAGTMSEVRWYGTLGVGGIAGTVRYRATVGMVSGCGTRGAVGTC